MAVIEKKYKRGSMADMYVPIKQKRNEDCYKLVVKQSIKSLTKKFIKGKVGFGTTKEQMKLLFFQIFFFQTSE